jgi:hypothetical protein
MKSSACAVLGGEFDLRLPKVSAVGWTTVAGGARPCTAPGADFLYAFLTIPNAF